MRVRLGNMLGKGCRVGRIAALVVRWAWEVPLGIKHDLRRVGGLCAPNRTSAPGLPGTSEPVVRSGVDSGMSVARALLQLQKPARVRLAAFLAVLDGSKTSRAEKIFFVKKWAYGGPQLWQFKYCEKSFFGPAGFSTVKNSQKGPQNHPGLLPLLQQCSGNGISTATTVDPQMPIFFTKKNFFRPSLIFHRQ